MSIQFAEPIMNKQTDNVSAAIEYILRDDSVSPRSYANFRSRVASFDTTYNPYRASMSSFIRFSCTVLCVCVPASIMYLEPGDNWKQLVDQVGSESPASASARRNPSLTSPHNSRRDRSRQRRGSSNANSNANALSAASTPAFASAPTAHQQELQPRALSSNASAFSAAAAAGRGGGGGGSREEREQNGACESSTSDQSASTSTTSSTAPSAHNEYSAFPTRRSPLVSLAPGAPAATAASSSNLAGGPLPARSPGLGYLLGEVSGAHRQLLAPNPNRSYAQNPPGFGYGYEPTGASTSENESTDM